MAEVNRREAMTLASAAGLAGIVGSLTGAAGAEGPDKEPAKQGKLKVLGLGEARLAFGSTVPGEGWQAYPSEKENGIFIDVDTAEAHFKAQPVYVISIGGAALAAHWAVTGGSSVYPRLDKEDKQPPMEGGFRVYLKFPADRGVVKLLEAGQKTWYVNWIGIGA